MDIKTLQKAYELKDLLKNDERIALLDKAEEDMSNDPEVYRLSLIKDEKNDIYNKMVSYYKEDSKEASEALHEFYLAKKEFEEHPKVREYLKHYQAVRELYDEINKILFEELNSELCPKKN